MYHDEKVLKASDQRDIVWFVSSACYFRRHCPGVLRTFCFTSVACEQALLFGRVKQVSRERVLARLASLAKIGELARRLY